LFDIKQGVCVGHYEQNQSGQGEGQAALETVTFVAAQLCPAAAANGGLPLGQWLDSMEKVAFMACQEQIVFHRLCLHIIVPD
jgi:hypothetical protein